MPNCLVCNKEFFVKYAARKYCSVECYKETVKEKADRLKIEKECPICKTKFMAKKPSGGLKVNVQRFCSKACSMKAMKRRFNGEYI